MAKNKFAPEIDFNELINGVKDLIKIPSILGKEKDGAKFLVELLGKLGFNAHLQPVENRRYNVICGIEGSQPGKTLLLNGHIDTVPVTKGWTSNPFEPKIIDGRLYGLGSVDMKSGLIALIYGLKSFLNQVKDFPGKIVYSAVVDEEGYSKGARNLLSRVRADAAIIGEPYNGINRSAVIGATGKILLEVKVIGKAAHAFRPWLGINAIEEAAKIISKIKEEPPTLDKRFGKIEPTILMIKGGYRVYNVTLPEKCIFQVNRLTLPEESERGIVKWIHEKVEKSDLKSKVKVEVKPPKYKGYVVDRNDEIINAFIKAFYEENKVNPKIGYRATITDANVITGEGGIPSIVYGTHGGNAHMANEYVEIKSILKATKVYAHTIRNYLTQKDRVM